MKVEELESKRVMLTAKLHQLNANYAILYQQSHQIADIQKEELIEELQNIRNHLQNLHTQKQQLNIGSNQKMQHKQQKIQRVCEFETKKSRLAVLSATEHKKLAEIRYSNFQVEEAIKQAREENENYQEEIHHLDQKKENLLRYGFETVPSSLLQLHLTKEVILGKIARLETETEGEKKGLNRMVSRDQVKECKHQIEVLQDKRQKTKLLEAQNHQLNTINEQISEAIAQYEWNPNLEIKNLQNSLDCQESHIATIQKAIAHFRKKIVDCQQKVENYKLKHNISKSGCEGSFFVRQGENSKRHKLIKEKALDRLSIYQSIKKEVENEKAMGQSQERKCQEVIGVRCYVLPKRTSVLQLLGVLVAIGVMMIWCWRGPRM